MRWHLRRDLLARRGPACRAGDPGLIDRYFETAELEHELTELPSPAGRHRRRIFMREIAYEVRGFLTVRRDSLRIPLSGSLALHADTDTGLFTGDLVLHQSAIDRTVLGARLVGATVQIMAGSPVIGGVDQEGRLFAAVMVDAVITDVRAAGRIWLSDGSCRTATYAVVPLRSRPGFNLERGGRVAGRYHRPPFTGCGWITPLVNLLVAGPGNAVVIDLIPLTS
jgi:hypothetical protein